MIESPARRAHLRPARLRVRFVLFPILFGAATAFGAESVAGQALSDSVAVRQAEYQRLRTNWLGAITNRQRAETELGRAIAAIDRAKTSDNANALEGAQRAAQAQAIEVARLDGWVSDARLSLDSARTRLLESLDQRVDSLEVRLLNARTIQEQDAIDLEVTDLQNQFDALVEEAESGIEEVPAYYPALAQDQRDTSSELRFKADLLDARAQAAEEEIEEARAEIDLLERRLRLQRTQADNRRNRDRFGDALPPVGNPGGRSGDPTEIVADTTGVPLDQLPLDQQILRWEGYIASLEVFRETVAAQAQLFRLRLNRTNPTRRAGGAA